MVKMNRNHFFGLYMNTVAHKTVVNGYLSVK